MAIIVRTCCCGCDLRTGILLIGIFGLVSACYEFVSSRLHVRVTQPVDGLAPFSHAAAPGRLQLCRFFNITFRKRFLMYFFLREFILYRLSFIAFSDLNHDIAFEN